MGIVLVIGLISFLERRINKREDQDEVVVWCGRAYRMR